MTRTNRANTRSGWQAYASNGKRTHTWGWIPADYGFIAADGSPAEGDFCENCGKWEGPRLRRGELARMRGN